MTDEQLKKADEVRNQIQDLENHQERITGTMHSSYADRVKWGSTKMVTLDYDGVERQKLRHEFLPISMADIREVYLINLERKIISLKQQLADL